MRGFFLFLLAASAMAQSAQTYPTYTSENLRGVSAVSRQVAWVSGTHGTYLRTTDGNIWTPDQVPGAEALDFRAAVAFSADEAFLMSAGSGEQSRIYHTVDAGRHWDLQFTNKNPKGFFDSMVFWDSTHGVVLGDPIADEAGKLKFELLMTSDGKTWSSITANLPPAIEGEGAFAASNSCIAVLPAQGDSVAGSDSNLWFATGGKAARVFHSADRGKTWQVSETPIAHGPDSAGIFSIAFRDATHGILAGGDYKHPDEDGPNLASTNDGGKTWTLSAIHPQAYFSDVAYDRKYKSPNSKNLDDNRAQVRIFLANPKFLFDFRPPADPTRISPPKQSSMEFNAIAPYPEGGALVVGPKGSIARIP
jgi:photosystem II stability/assembly factor-like uncharacterized protein